MYHKTGPKSGGTIQRNRWKKARKEGLPNKILLKRKYLKARVHDLNALAMQSNS